MLRVFLGVVFAILLADTSGLTALASPETCTSLTDSVPDGKCPSLCVRCGCAQPTEATVVAPIDTAEIVVPVSESYTRVLTSGAPHDILHVPR